MHLLVSCMIARNHLLYFARFCAGSTPKRAYYKELCQPFPFIDYGSIWPWNKSVSPEESLITLFSDFERKSFFLPSRFYSTGSQFNAILRRWPSLYCQWVKEQVFSFKKWLLSMWHLYCWTNVTEMAKWSTTGFSLQCQSLTRINKTSDGNCSNHQLEDIFLMYEQIPRTLRTVREN